MRKRNHLSRRALARWCALLMCAGAAAIVGCASPQRQFALDPYDVDTPLRVIDQFFRDNPPTTVDVVLTILTRPPRLVVLQGSEAAGVIQAVRADTHAVPLPADPLGLGETPPMAGLSLDSSCIVSLHGPHYTLAIWLSQGAGFTIGYDHDYIVTNPRLAEILRAVYVEQGLMEGYGGRWSDYFLKKAVGETCEEPEPTEAEEAAMAAEQERLAYAYDMSPEEAAALRRLKAVVKAEGDINRPDDDGTPPLVQAARQGWRTVLEFLLLHGADVTASDNTGCGALAWATRRRNRACAAMLILKGASVNSSDSSNRTPLYWAVTEGFQVHPSGDPESLAMVRMLLEAGASVDFATIGLEAPLHGAASSGMSEAIPLLVEAGADLEALDNGNRTPLHLAISGFRPEAAMALLACGAKPDLVARAQRIRPEWVGQFLDKYPEVVNISGPAGNRPLHYAAMKGQKDIVRLLLERGADVAVKNKQGETALDLARKKGREDVVALLEAPIAKRKERSPKP